MSNCDLQMFSRAAIRIGTGCSIGALFVTTAYAAENKKLVKVSELPIYGEPHPPQLVYVDEEISAFRKHISVARQTVWEYSDSVKVGFGVLLIFDTVKE